MGMQTVCRRILAAAVPAGFVVVPLFWPEPALAQVGDALDASVRALETVFRQSADTLGVWARQLLLGLLVLDLVWRSGKWLLSGQSVGEFAEPMVYTIGIVGLAWGFTTLAPDVVGWVARQATILSNDALPGAGSALTPSGIMGAGLDRALEWVEAANVLDPESWALLVCAFIALVMMAAELAMVILVYAEMYLVGLVGLVTLGFAGLAQTRGVATRYVMTMFAKGFKLMTLLLVADAAHGLAEIAEATTRTVGQTTNSMRFANVPSPTSFEGSVTVAGAMSAVLLQMIGVALMLTLPAAVERLVAGAAVGDAAGTGGRMVAGAAVSGGVAAAGAALGATGGAAAAGGPALKAARGMDPASAATSVAKSVGLGALKGGVNWGQVASERGGIGKELGARLSDRVNRMGARDPEGDS